MNGAEVQAGVMKKVCWNGSGIDEKMLLKYVSGIDEKNVTEMESD